MALICRCQLDKASRQGFGVSDIVREMFGRERSFAELTNGQHTTENLVRSVLTMGD